MHPCGHRALAASAALAAAALAAGPASAAFPGGNGKIVFEDDGVLKSIEATGGLASIPNSSGVTEPAISADGTHIAVNGIKTFNLSGDDQKTLASGLRPAWSPDGKKIVYDSGGDLFVINADGTGLPQSLTSGADNDLSPSWDPSGTRIAFIRNQQVWALKPAEPGISPWKVSSTDSVHDGPSWSPDGTKVVYSIDDGTIVDLYVSTVPAPPVDPSNPPTPAAGDRITENGSSAVFNDEPAWSPDGTRIAFSSNRTGAREIWTVAAPGGGDERQMTTSGGRRPDWQAGERTGKHYRVELKAWIPKAAIVDPNIPYEVPFAALGFAPLTLAVADERRPCNAPGLQALALLVRSNFGGDTHAEYDGSFRVRPVAEFDWNGSQITSFVVTSPPEHFGITSLDYKFREIGGGATQECSVRKQQVAAAGGTQLSANSFELSMSADDPLVYPRTSGPDSPLVPNIDARLRGTVQPDGRLSIDYDTDLFPSHGLRVTVDGRDLETQVTNDVSCLADSSVQGLFGMGLLASALSAHVNVGSVVVDPAQAPRSSSAPGRVCTGEFSTVDFVSLGRSLLGSASAASAASTLRVAPLDSAGKPGRFVTLKQAVAEGLVARQDISTSHFVLGINPDQPVALRSRGQMALTATRLVQGRRGRPAQFGPITGRINATVARSSVRVTRNGKRVRPRKPDNRPPKTSAEVRVKGGTALVTFKARDRTGVQATVVTLNGKRLKMRRQRLRIARSKLSKLRVFSVDVYGNPEKPKRIRRR